MDIQTISTKKVIVFFTFILVLLTFFYPKQFFYVFSYTKQRFAGKVYIEDKIREGICIGFKHDLVCEVDKDLAKFWVSENCSAYCFGIPIE